MTYPRWKDYDVDMNTREDLPIRARGIGDVHTTLYVNHIEKLKA